MTHIFYFSILFNEDWENNFSSQINHSILSIAVVCPDTYSVNDEENACYHFSTDIADGLHQASIG